jgi:hypothetical protein
LNKNSQQQTFYENNKINTININEAPKRYSSIRNQNQHQSYNSNFNQQVHLQNSNENNNAINPVENHHYNQNWQANFNRDHHYINNNQKYIKGPYHMPLNDQGIPLAQQFYYIHPNDYNPQSAMPLQEYGPVMGPFPQIYYNGHTTPAIINNVNPTRHSKAIPIVNPNYNV